PSSRLRPYSCPRCSSPLFPVRLHSTSSPSPPSLSFLTATASPETYTLSLHDALPIWEDFRKAVVYTSAKCVFRLVSKEGVGSEADRKSTRLNSSHVSISYAVFCLKKKKAHQGSAQACPRRLRSAWMTHVLPPAVTATW